MLTKGNNLYELNCLGIVFLVSKLVYFSIIPDEDIEDLLNPFQLMYTSHFEARL